MKSIRKSGWPVTAIAFVAGCVVSAAFAKPWNVTNSLHVEYDDNIAEQQTNEIDSWKVLNQLTLSLAEAGEPTNWSLRYHLVATWWEAREDKEWTFDHLVDLDLRHALTPQLNLDVTERFVRRDNSELIDEDGRVVVGESSYTYNSLNVAANVGVTPNTVTSVSGRWQLLRYDDDRQAEREDYDIYSAGVTVRNRLQRETIGLLEARVEKTEYVDGGKTVDYLPLLPGAEGQGRQQIPDRSSTAYIGGVGFEQIFSPNLMGRATAGYMLKDFDAANTDSESGPYADAAVTLMPTERTRFTLGASHSLYQSSLLTFSTQRRTAVSASLGHDVTARLNLHLSGTYVNSDYKAKTSVDTVSRDSVRDGTEDAFMAGVRAVYWVDRPRKHAIEAGWSISDLSSDLRSEYTRNRYDVGWRIQF